MSPPKRPRVHPSRGRRRLVILLAGVATVAVLLVFGCDVLAYLAGRMAARQFDKWAIGAAQQWLARAIWLDPDDGELELMRAACHRRLGETDPWLRALQSAERKGAPGNRIEQEKQLVALGLGRPQTNAEDLFVALVGAGVSPQDASTALLAYYLDHSQCRKARLLMDRLEAEYPDDPHVAYLWGLYWRLLREYEKAGDHCRIALAAEPRHQLARELIAGLSEIQDRPDLALRQHLDSLANFPESARANVDVARGLRRLNHTSEARALLTPFVSRPETRSNAVLEMGQVELESGNYEEAQRWFGGANLEGRAEKLLPAAITSGIVGDTARADRLFARYDAKVIAAGRADDLQIRLSINPSDGQSVDELQQLLRTHDLTESSDTGSSHEELPKEHATSASELYVRECGTCHGANGDGKGRAARHLFPRPLDLRAGRFRLASTLSGVPISEDLDAVLRQGIPGTSMPAFENLSESERKLLVQEVFRLLREGIRAAFIREWSHEGEGLDEDEIAEAVQQYVTPGEVIRVPVIGPADSGKIERGRRAYSELGCHHCHGDDGRGNGDMPLLDDSGRPTRPRDLVYESFKGGQESDSVYRRIFAGMPGTPHPACRNVPEATLVDLVHYCLSLSRDPKLELTNHERAIWADSGAYVSAVPGSPEP